MQKWYTQILLVEDDPEVQAAVSLGLSLNYKIFCTDNAEDALKIIKSNKIDLILMDINIKGCIDGLQLTAHLKSSNEFAGIPVIALTALNSEKDKNNCLTAGCCDHISKPHNLDDLFYKISKLI